MENKIKNIWFDWGRVLVGLDFNRCVDAFAQLGIADLKHELATALFLDYEKGLMTSAAFRERVKVQFGLKVDDEGFDAAWNTILTDIPSEKLDFISSLRPHYQTALLSNTNEIHWQCGADKWVSASGKCAKDYFDHIFLSYEMQLAKPDVEIFLDAIRRSGVIPNETLFIDDLLPNCQAAEAAGLHAVQYTEGADLAELITQYLKQ